MRKLQPAGTNSQADLLAVLREVKRPMNLDEMSRARALPFRSVKSASRM